MPFCLYDRFAATPSRPAVRGCTVPSRPRLPRLAPFFLLAAVLFSLATTPPARAQAPSPTATPAPEASSEPAPEPTPQETPSVTINLNNVSIDQLVKFLSETTGKPVIKQKDIDTRLSVFSPTPMTRRGALELIYNALQLENIYVIETEDKIQIVSSLERQGLEVEPLDDDVDVQTLPDSLAVARKSYQLQNIPPADLKLSLATVIPASAMVIDARTKTLTVTDQIIKLKRYDLAIKTLDSIATTDRLIEVFELKHADAIQLGILIGNILTNTALYETGGQKYGGVMSGLSQLQTLSTQVRSRTPITTSTPIMIGDVTMVPDPRTNWLIVSAPPEKMEEVRRLVTEFDTEQKIDFQIRMIPLKHVDARMVYYTLTQLFAEVASSAAAKDVVRIVASYEGNNILVYSNAANFTLVEQIVMQMDTEDASRQEPRTYRIENLEVADLSTQLSLLYQSSIAGRTSYGRGASASVTAKFVPSARSNSLLVLAYPREFDFIEELVKALDVPAAEGAFEPRMFKIRNTDAGELVKVLSQIFSGPQRTGVDAYYWRISGGDKDGIESLYGKIRFVTDTSTNTIVAIASNPKNYDIVAAMVAELDRLDPESSDILVHKLKYADAMQLADQINNLLSDGAVTRPAPAPTPAISSDSQAALYAQTTNRRRDIVYPWQSAQAQRSIALGEQPINRMIGNVRVVPDMRSNKLLVTAQPAYIAPLKRIIDSLDQPEPQVHISTRMIEISRGQDRRIGIRWTPDPSQIDPAELDNAMLGLGRLGFLDAFGAGAGTIGVKSATSPASDFGSLTRTVESTLPGGNLLLGGDVNISLLVQLLVKNSNSRIISEPALTVNNNELGNIFVGSEFPFRVNSQTTDQGATTFGVEYRKVGIDLFITPHINGPEEVDLRIALENSSIRPGETVDGQIIKDQRQLNTQVQVGTGQTMVIGGILLEDENRVRRGFPILDSIPLVNRLTGKTDRTQLVRELLVFITPEILEGSEDSQRVVRESLEEMQKIEDMRDQRTIPRSPILPGWEPDEEGVIRPPAREIPSSDSVEPEGSIEIDVDAEADSEDGTPEAAGVAGGGEGNSSAPSGAPAALAVP